MTNVLLQNNITPINQAGFTAYVLLIFVEVEPFKNCLKVLQMLALNAVRGIESWILQDSRVYWRLADCFVEPSTILFVEVKGGKM